MRAKSSGVAGRGLAVLQVGPLYNNHLARWSAHAASLGCSVSAAGHVSPGRQPVDLTGVAEHVEITPEGLSSLGSAPHVAWLRDVVCRLDPDVIHAHWLPKWGYFTTLCADRPFVVTAWGSDVYLATGAPRRRADWTLHNAGHLLARSAHMQRAMVARGARAERVHQVDLGVDLERFRPAQTAEQARIRSELGLPAGPLILSMRAGTPLYNLDVVLEAFRIVRERVNEATLVLVHGDAPLSARVRALLSELRGGGAVRAVGHIAHAEMPRYLRAATACVSIPSSDGSPSSVWEALASGVPMVVSALPQIAEKVGRSGAVNLVQARRETVASALIDIIASPDRRERMAQAARAWAVANIGEQEQIERLGRVYELISEDARRRPARGTATAAELSLRPS